MHQICLLRLVGLLLPDLSDPMLPVSPVIFLHQIKYQTASKAFSSPLKFSFRDPPHETRFLGNPLFKNARGYFSFDSGSGGLEG